MNVLGIADNHDSGAALVVDGEPVFAVSEERLNREKNTHAFPWQAINLTLQEGGLDPDELDLIIFGTRYTPATPLRATRQLHRTLAKEMSQFSYMLNAYLAYQSVLNRIPGGELLEELASRALLRRSLERRALDADLRLMDHHESHACSAMLTGPFAESLVITADAMGDATSLTVGLGQPDGSYERLYRQSGFSAISTYYSRVTEYLGFKPNRHEGKITGLAAMGDPEPLLPVMRKMLRFEGPGLSTLNHLLPARQDGGLFALLEGHSREDVAAALQENLEREFCALTRHWIQRTGRRHICLAGGVFANVKLNQAMHSMPEVEGIHVYPHMGDGGLPMGAALAVETSGPKSLPHMYWGPGYTRERCERAATEAGLRCRPMPDPAREMAQLLSEDKVVARFAGRMELGPRALGHRSLLYRPDDPSVNDWLNDALGRSEFMPFAPVTTTENARRCYKDIEGAESPARFMATAFHCTEEMKEKCSGAVHVDGTARPQIISADEAPVYHGILEHFEALTGIPSIINTSFNMHEEPIVCTPEDAVRAYLATGLDRMVLVMEDLVVERGA